MIYTHIPYCPKDKGKDLGYAYNKFMEKLDPEDWAVFLDHDAMFTTYNWYHQIEEIINNYSDIGAIYATTNGTSHKNQLCLVTGLDLNDKRNIYNVHDIKLHRKIGKKIQEKNKLTMTNAENFNPLSGMVIIIQKQTWTEIGGCKSGFLGVDNDIFRKVKKLKNKRVYIAEGLYVYHWYREENYE